MKTFSTLFWVMCSLTMVNAAQAAAPTVLYDNFTAALINPSLVFQGPSLVFQGGVKYNTIN